MQLRERELLLRHVLARGSSHCSAQPGQPSSVTVLRPSLSRIARHAEGRDRQVVKAKNRCLEKAKE